MLKKSMKEWKRFTEKIKFYSLRTKQEYFLYKRTKQVHIIIYSDIALIKNVCEIGVSNGSRGR